MENKLKIIATLPCYNESRDIANLVFSTNQFVFGSIVADDNSTDDTASKAKEAGAYVVRNFRKRGYGSNSKTGIEEALDMGCDIIVTLDGDGQHNPEEMYRVIEPIEKGEADVVVGSRFIKQNGYIPRYRKFGIKVITWVYNVGYKDKLTDVQCCFRAYKADVLRKINLNESGFTFSTETLIKARAMGYRIKEVPVTVIYHKQFSRNSTSNPISQGIRVALGTAKIRILTELFKRA